MSLSVLSVELIKKIVSQVKLSFGMDSSMLVLTQTAHKKGRFEDLCPVSKLPYKIALALLYQEITINVGGDASIPGY
jgi:hypothetical protein